MIRSTTIAKPGKVHCFYILFFNEFTFLKHFSSFAPILDTPQSDSEQQPPSIGLTSRLFSILSRPNWQKNPSLKTLIPSLTPNHVSSLLNLNLDPHAALSFFNWISQRPGFKHNAVSYSAMLNALVNARLLGPAKQIRVLMIKACESIDEMNFILGVIRKMSSCDGFKFKLTLRCYNILLMSLSRFLMIDEMNAVYLEILDEKIPPNIYTFNTMVNAYCKVGNVVEAQLYVSKIMQAGLDPDTFTYTSLILGHCRSNNVDTAYGVFRVMPTKGCCRNEVSYTNLIHGLCEDGRVDEALRLFKQMPEDNCLPTVRTYTVLVNALCHCGRKSEAFDLFKEMPDKGCEPNVHTYTVLIDSTCKDGELDKARSLFALMSEKGLVPSAVAYNALLDGYCKDGSIDAMLEILDMMEKNGCCPNVRTYNEVILGFCKKKKIHNAMALLNKMLGKNLTPTLITYNTLIHGQCNEGDLDTAFRLLDLMKENSLAPDQWTYSILIDTISKYRKLEEAQELFNSLKEKEIEANEVIYTALIDGYCKAGKIDYALSLFETMLKEKCFPNSSTYNALINGLCIEKKLHEASSLLVKMVEVGVKPTIVTYTIIIEAMLKDGSFENSCKVFDQMISVGYKPDVVVYTAFLRTYCSHAKIKEAEDLVTQMNEGGVKLDVIAFTVLMDGYGRVGSISGAFEVLKRMFLAGCQPSSYTYSLLLKHLLCEKEKKEGVNGLDLDSNVNLIDVANVWKIVELELVVDLLEKMVEHGCSPSLNTYGALISELCKEGRLQEAENLFSHMKNKGMSSSEEILNSLLCCRCKLGLYDQSLKLVDDMIEHNILPHLESCRLLLCGLYDKGEKGKAKTVFSTLLHCDYNHDEVAWKLLIDGLLTRGFIDEYSELLNYNAVADEHCSTDKPEASPKFLLLILVSCGSYSPCSPVLHRSGWRFSENYGAGVITVLHQDGNMVLEEIEVEALEFSMLLDATQNYSLSVIESSRKQQLETVQVHNTHYGFHLAQMVQLTYTCEEPLLCSSSDCADEEIEKDSPGFW
ncbi:Pentatricopeptide repeat [Dillenia turbinata]|uniref:Pentatricopeptide repeat n=1 Tax=Dillenia turbinata TaxID=194707 RepID=A0AAN8Z2B5_9MAGN